MFFDIGANVGKWSLANIATCDKIIAVEASPDTFNKLFNNTNINPKIVCLNFAVCNSNDEYVTFYNSNADTISTMNKDWLDNPVSRFYKYATYNTITCKSIKIDKLIEIYGVPNLIKIDVEGGEFECLTSLTQKVSNLCFEWASETNTITFDCIDYLEKIGFTEFSIQFEDKYTYRPQVYTDKSTVIQTLNKTTAKKEWGMVWAR